MRTKLNREMKTEINNKICTISYGATYRTDDGGNEDYVVKSIGVFGVWQTKCCTIAASTRIIAMWNMMSIVFLTPLADFVCVNFKNNGTVTVQNNTCYEDCIEYTYDENVLESTLISEFDLICDRSWLASFTQTVLMFGLVLGVALFGWISDRFGRRKALLLSTFINVIFMIAAPFSPNYWTFNCLRFFIGMASGGNLIISVVYVLEIVGPKHREVAGCCAMLPDGIAEVLLALFAYLSYTWNAYLLVYSVLSIFFLISVVFLPETPRWLVSNGRVNDAVELLTEAAKCNNLSTDKIRENVIKSLESVTYRNDGPKTTYFDLFRTRETSVKTISCLVIWTVTGICYFGINQYVTFLGSNVFVAVTFLGLIQVPSNPLAMMLNKIFGRKASTIGTLMATSVTMLLLIFIPSGHWMCIALGITGLSVSSATFAILYVYTSELFPTPLRNMGYGFSSGGAKIGAMGTPFIASISLQWIPSLIFSVLPFVAALFCLLLPETKGRKLED